MLKQSPPQQVWAFIWFYLSKVKYIFFSFLCVNLLGEVCRQTGFFYASRIAGVMTQIGDKETQLRTALYYIFLLGFFMLARTLFVNSRGLLTARYIPRLGMLLTRDLFERAHLHSIRFFAEEMSGRIASKINQTVQQIVDLNFTFEAPFTTFVRLSVGFYFLTQIHVSMGLMLIIFVILYAVFLFLTARKMIVYSEESHNRYSIANGVLTDTLFNYAVVKNDGKIKRENIYFLTFLKPWIKADRQIYYAEFVMFSVQGILRGFLQATFLFLPLYLWYQNKISVADFVLAESLIAYLTTFAMDIGHKVSQFYRQVGGIQDGINFIFQQIHVSDKTNRRLLVPHGNIVFQDVDFAYQTSKGLLFNRFNLTIQAGDKVGLIGASGSGKSSLIKLVCRYYDVQNGCILIDGQNIADVTQESLRQHIAVIEQNPALFNRSIIDNIRYGCLDATDEAVILASKQAFCHDFIMQLPNGYQTVVGERGVTLSGGERQRIAIARAILKNAPILILDEATSALDSESEFYIQKALTDVMKHKTVIAIAHRLSTLREMDYLIVMEQGQIIQQGTHMSLLKAGGAYADFYHLQTRRREG